MRSEDSSENEECSHDSWEKFSSTARCEDCGYTWMVEPPKDSGSSSPDDECAACAHRRSSHPPDAIPACNLCYCAAFVPADAETAGDPECDHPSGCQFKDSGCVKACAFGDQLKGIRMMPRPKAAPPRRPPYAVAYEIGDGRLYEVALPGDAVATVEDGVLKVSHAAGVAHIVQVKSMGTEQ